MQARKNDHSLGELFAELARETGTLVRQEMDLTKAELTEKATRVGKDIASLAIGGAILYAGLLGILAAVAIALATVMPWWLAALLVGLVVAGAGYFLVRRGLDALKREELAPRQTIETLKQDAQWAKEQVQ